MNMPTEAPHFFTEIDMGLMQGLDVENFLKLGHFAKINNSTNKFDLLRDAIRKFQWAVAAANLGRTVNGELMSLPVDQYLLADPTAQMIVSKAVFEVVIYGKASLDSLAQFISEYFSLGVNARGCDFKWDSFREAVEEKALRNGLMTELESWLTKESKATDSISATRDSWIHRGFITVPFLWPPNDLGCFCVAKRIEFDPKELVAVTSSSEFFFSLGFFFDKHEGNIARLIRSVLESVIWLEAKGRAYVPAQHVQGQIFSFFPVGITVGMECVGVKMGPYSSRNGLQFNSAASFRQSFCPDVSYAPAQVRYSI